MALFRKNQEDKNQENKSSDTAEVKENRTPQECGKAEDNAVASAGTGAAADRKAAESAQETPGMPAAVSGYRFAADVKLKECKYCRVMIPRDAKICPNCKMRLKKHWLRYLILVLILAALVCGGVYWYLYVYQGQMASGVWTETVTALADTAAAEPTAAESVEQAAAAEQTAAELQEQAAAETATAEPTDQTAAEQTAGNVAWTAAEAQTTDSADHANNTEDAEHTDNAETAVPSASGSTLAEFPLMSETAEETEELENAKAEEEEDENADSDDMMLLSNIGDTDTDVDEGAEEETEEDADEEAFREKCEEVSYKALLRQQEEYLNQAVSVEVTVLEQVDGGLFDENIYYFCVAQDADGRDRYYIIRDDRGEDAMLILEGDVLVIYGKLFGDCRLPAGLAAARPTVPALSMLYCDLLEE